MAFSLSPSPNVLATMADPPVPNISPIVENIIKKGMIKLTAANGVFPAKLDTKKPSTTLYIDVHIIMPIVGKEKRNSLL